MFTRQWTPSERERIRAQALARESIRRRIRENKKAIAASLVKPGEPGSPVNLNLSQYAGLTNRPRVQLSANQGPGPVVARPADPAALTGVVASPRFYEPEPSAVYSKDAVADLIRDFQAPEVQLSRKRG